MRYWPESTVESLWPLRVVAEATELRKRSELEWREALCSAVERHSLREVAKVAGVSHARVAQIVGRKR